MNKDDKEDALQEMLADLIKEGQIEEDNTPSSSGNSEAVEKDEKPFQSSLFCDIAKDALDVVDIAFYGNRDGSNEYLCVRWSANFKNGLIRKSGNNEYTQTPLNEIEYADGSNILIDISSNGFLQIRQGDEDEGWFETTINNSCELKELLDFYENDKIPSTHQDKKSKTPLNKLISSLKLLAWDNDHVAKAIPINTKKLKQLAPEVFQSINQRFIHDLEYIFDALSSDNVDDPDINDIGAPGRYLAEHQHFEEFFQHADDINPNDIIISCEGEVTSGSTVLNNHISFVVWDAVSLVLKPDQKHSSAWLFDFFKHSIEAESVIAELVKNWSNLSKATNKIFIYAPPYRSLQMLDMTERRLARKNYVEEINTSLQIREPFNSMKGLYKSRSSIAKSLHTDLLDDMIALHSPLPFFLEYPYQIYRKEDDPVRKIKAAQRLLSVLIKVPLYLILEELSQQEDSEYAEITNTLQDRPASDGSALGLLRSAIKAHSGYELSMLEVLTKQLGNLELYDDLITARNRMHHEPYDEEGFLSAMELAAPEIIRRIREALAQLRFIIPKSMQIKEGKRIIFAENISNSDGNFRHLDFETKLPFEAFPTGEIVVYHDEEKNEESLTLTQFFTSKTVMKKSRDFGIFDRFQNDEPQFIFLRTE